MTRLGTRFFGVLATVAAAGILAAILLPPWHTGIQEGRAAACASNLRQLYQLGVVYASAHDGHWPTAKGSAFWLAFTKTAPPLIGQDELEVLLCPVKGEPEPGHCDYLGPALPFPELQPGDALAADKPGNHGDGRAGNILLKNGSVREFEYSEPIWKSLAE